MNICKSWENEFLQLKMKKYEKLLSNFYCSGKYGRCFSKTENDYKTGFRRKTGRGNQMVSWIHVDDFCRAVDCIIQNENLSGTVNITAPNPLSNQSMMRKLRNKIRIPFGLNAPVWQLEIASIFLNTETELLLKSRNVYPEKLIKTDLNFHILHLMKRFLISGILLFAGFLRIIKLAQNYSICWLYPK